MINSTHALDLYKDPIVSFKARNPASICYQADIKKTTEGMSVGIYPAGFPKEKESFYLCCAGLPCQSHSTQNQYKGMTPYLSCQFTLIRTDRYQ